MAVEARTPRLGFYMLVLVGMSERRAFREGIILAKFWRVGQGAMRLVWREYLFSSTLLVSPGQSVKAAIWTRSPGKGSCIPESTGLGSKSGEGGPDVLDTEQPAVCWAWREAGARPV